MASFEKINYLLRPNKSVERKMVCEMLGGIASVKDLSAYQYIGFGSTYFADFSLFHRNLGITKMISIEGNNSARGRCEFNKPFGCIELRFGHSSTVLPNLAISENDSIIWLDYDGMISDSVFSDIDTVVTQMKPDSFFMLSINAEIKALDSEARKENLPTKDYLVELLGEERFPKKFLDKDMSKKLYLKILYTCITQQIFGAVQRRNGMEECKVTFRQTIHIEYRDGIRMLTIGGFLFDKDKADTRLEAMRVAKMPFYRDGEDIYVIQCPSLSLKEIQALNIYLPCTPMDKNSKQFEDEALNDFPVNNQDIDNYASLYRYFPNFAETLL